MFGKSIHTSNTAPRADKDSPTSLDDDVGLGLDQAVESRPASPSQRNLIFRKLSFDLGTLFIHRFSQILMKFFTKVHLSSSVQSKSIFLKTATFLVLN